MFKKAHSSFERATLLAPVQCRKVKVDERFSLRGPALFEAIEKDRNNGLIPFFVCATLGTTSICSYDNLEEIGPICMLFNLSIFKKIKIFPKARTKICGYILMQRMQVVHSFVQNLDHI